MSVIVVFDELSDAGSDPAAKAGAGVVQPPDGYGRRPAGLVAVFAAILIAILIAVLVAAPTPAAAASPRALARTTAMRAGIAISAPVSVNLGSRPTGSGTLSASFGTVTVDDTRGLIIAGSWTATVSTTDFKTGAGTANQTIVKANIAYASLLATATSGFGVFTPGQPTVLLAQSLSVPRTAFTGSLVTLINSASWNPTIVVTVPAASVAGTYTGTITHSVA
jgi:hypothetical protein